VEGEGGGDMSEHWRRIEFRASRDWTTMDRISLRGAETSSDHSPAVFMPIGLKTTNENGEVIPPFLQLDERDATALMDALWSVGCRPTEGHGSVGQLAATEAHLYDMRKLVFKREGLAL
jgi:hypothetical protein